MLKIPTQVPKEIFELVRTVKTTAGKQADLLSVHIIVDKTASRELVMTIKDLLRPVSGEVILEVDELYEVQPHRAIPMRDVCFMICGSKSERVGVCASSYSESHIPTLIVADQNSEIPPAESVKSNSKAPVSLICIDQLEDLSSKLTSWIMDQNDELIQKFVKVFSFLRAPYFDKLISTCAKENAMIAAMPINKADMPLMTLNTVKMASQMNWVMSRGMGIATVAEMGCIMSSGYLMRAIARMLPQGNPVTKTTFDVAVSYAGTVACGKVLKNYYQVIEKFPLKVPIQR